MSVAGLSNKCLFRLGEPFIDLHTVKARTAVVVISNWTMVFLLTRLFNNIVISVKSSVESG
ncbi:hypothetical protein H5410_008721 [Solanum commersonii]|uniref:Uncharacterized protein n=1 Tax=Solanum commersonii TaxID=4109 RepID=A0A9J6AHK3_SOLCO|nr:hypothetical protein H5410_008721 [Solanum commersonii]